MFLFSVSIFGILGCILIYNGLAIKQGTLKRWYLGSKIFPPQALAYILMPLGLIGVEIFVMGLLSSLFTPDTNGWILGFIVIPTVVISYILAFWRPRWIKPEWVNWLEDNYSDQLHILIENARQNPWAWEKRVSTQEGLEAWAKSVAGDPQPKMKV